MFWSVVHVIYSVGQFLWDLLGRAWKPSSWPKWARRTYVILLPIGFIAQIIITGMVILYITPVGLGYAAWDSDFARLIEKIWKGERE